MAETRSIEQEVFVAATPQDVWRALTDPDELIRWFPVHARVEPGVGGSIWISWGEGAEATAPITVWEPNGHIGWANDYGSVRLAVDFQLEPAEGGTIVRLVHSGFGTGAEWDEQFHMTEGGWQYFMQNLRHALERHPGVPRDLVSCREKLGVSGDAAYAAVTGPRGLAARGTLRGLHEGDAFSVTTATGDVLTGTVIVQREPVQLGLLVDNLNDALLLLEIEPAGEGSVQPGFWLSTYGLSPERLAALRSSMSRMYEAAVKV